ncbi:serine/threonine protein kinase [Nodularia spumigena CS-584]|uniref:histidine kinase n=1 Tax=Nodularia spumigena UHCC 0060 TaxID=3110300 RepID=A0ABU5UYF8_NODSP|nr:hypothetical protein [Nodularia spumigena]EAW43365.1 serine/threonine kinase with two-component sensor domain [Nodularia spumigena CCY9414]EAW46211.1 serine/threonine kinase with two-component sensor domain [Nodularia spumigena CCY9414]MDB9382989.1 serine/threonine protein kinase [Nodularia spumigena CS-584]MEA5524096.1 serine/threonine protein kinase [Nodularia spumigena UHCC 0143]MEA5558495.1 serine/threonine protein kinase [Nodularia spumigena CH309]
MAVAICTRKQDKTRQLKQSLKDLQEVQIQLMQREKMSSLGNLIAGIAHEINNPVGLISGRIEQAKDAVLVIY